ncbi:unnamed protein product [Adineta steineri]|uniref:Fatty acid desaturase domain-containing protein n=1 Tax=Adineta steineri TaxID=433720 RepID=A0A818VK28_9BILA|nr:unnamed protein product [Adineta steineri]
MTSDSLPKNDFKGVTIACGIFILFSIFWYHALFQINITKSNWFDVIGTFICLEFLYTGLFITCHDAMHGAVCFRYRRLNNAIGNICFAAYAWFDYDRMHEKHWRHHNHTGIVKDDPDYHNGESIGFFSWYFHFMQEYVSIKQSIKMTLWVTSLLFIFSVPIANIIIYMLICGLCSSLRLFYFGTYIPHRPIIINGKFEKKMPWEKSKSSNVNRWISFLCCYHFDYHWEHHRWPYVPWWDLWKCKEIRRKMNEKKSQAQK